MTLSDRTALVTGASRGIGAAVARTLARRGTRVAVTYKQGRERAQGLIRSIASHDGTATSYPMDISHVASVETTMTAAMPAAKKAAVAEATPLGRLAEPEDNVIAFLASDDAR